MNPNHWLVNIRSEKNMTQEQVAELAGIDRSWYTKIEKGTTPSVKVAKKIASALDFPWTNFFEKNCDVSTQSA
ncbi:helix-turn-helix transcriptional regulator [Brevibacillus agri]|uniref:helix-turn-helix transcriptional regulator n=1 Tax=Brevibacillus agri TaxID=51101 RepID=UPI003D22300C